MGLDHCHGTLVRHADGVVECTDAGCVATEVVRHTLVIECESVEGGCSCAADPADGHRELPRAS